MEPFTALIVTSQEKEKLILKNKNPPEIAGQFKYIKKQEVAR